MLPEPILIREMVELGGTHYIVPIELGDYFEGYVSTVQDVYVADFWRVHGSEWQKQWKFIRRERVFHKPMHYDLNGKTYRCERCEAFWKITPYKSTEIIYEVAT